MKGKTLIHRHRSVEAVKKSAFRKNQNPSKSRSKFSNVVTPITGDSDGPAKSQPNAPADLAEQISQTVDLSALKKKINQSPDMDMSRVVSLHNRLDAGEYCIDYEELVRKLLSLEEQLHFD